MPYVFIQDKIDILNFSMKTASKELQKLRSMAESSLNKTAELQQLLAQIEATLSRAESQQVFQKTLVFDQHANPL